DVVKGHATANRHLVGKQRAAILVASVEPGAVAMKPPYDVGTRQPHRSGGDESVADDQTTADPYRVGIQCIAADVRSMQVRITEAKPTRDLGADQPDTTILRGHAVEVGITANLHPVGE